MADKTNSLSLIPAQRIERRILLLRGHRVMLDFDLAELYGAEARAVNQAVKFSQGFECFRHVPILMVSSIPIAPAARFSMAGEVDMVTPNSYLTKPVDITAFLDEVRVLLGDQEAQGSGPGEKYP